MSDERELLFRKVISPSCNLLCWRLLPLFISRLVFLLFHCLRKDAKEQSKWAYTAFVFHWEYAYFLRMFHNTLIEWSMENIHVGFFRNKETRCCLFLFLLPFAVSLYAFQILRVAKQFLLFFQLCYVTIRWFMYI